MTRERHDLLARVQRRPQHVNGSARRSDVNELLVAGLVEIRGIWICPTGKIEEHETARTTAFSQCQCTDLPRPRNRVCSHRQMKRYCSWCRSFACFRKPPHCDSCAAFLGTEKNR